MSFGYLNKLLEIDLSSHSIKTITLPEEYWRKYIGGKSLGSKLLLDYKVYENDPYDEKNPIILLTGPLAGSNVPGAVKASFYSKSPQTGIYLDSTCGGSLAFRLKAAGYDGLIILGKSESPVYITITDSYVRIEKADELWGKGCFETESLLRNKHGRDCAVALIGPAGENKVKYASLHTDFYHQSGRGGVGALWGSKKLKALVVSGETPVSFYKTEELIQKGLQLVNQSRNDPKVVFRGKYGTLSTLDLTQKLGIAPVKNFTDGICDRYDSDMNRDYLKANFVQRSLACFGCPIPCGKGSRFSYQGKELYLGGPEYEAISLIGTNLVLKAEDMVYLNWLCDDLGIDTVSSGVTLSCAIDAFMSGQIGENDMGFKIEWGDVENIARAFRAIANREGIGDLLAEGSKKFTEAFHLNSDNAIQVKGLEIPGYDPRGTTGYGLAFAVADRGGCHRRARPIYKEQDDDTFRFSYEGKGALVKELEDQRAFYHSLIVCDFIPAVYPIKVKEYAEMLNLATGWDIDEKEAVLIGERAINQARLFNTYCGINRQNDTLPKRFFKEKLPRGRAAGQILDSEKFQAMLSDYYNVRGWDDEGIPTSSKLTTLGIEGGK